MALETLEKRLYIKLGKERAEALLRRIAEAKMNAITKEEEEG